MRYSLTSLAVLAAVVSTASAHPQQRPFNKRQTTTNQERADAVVQTFRIGWDGYYKYAFPHDELHPIAMNSSDSFSGWGASAVDAFSTALVMGQKDIANIILDYIPTIDYDCTASQTSLFETTIRYIGGMLAGYDLLKGPLASMAENTTNVDLLLKQAERLANNLAYSFDTPTGIPHNNLFIVNKTDDGATDNGLATIGTLVLEWTHLSDLSGNATYSELTQKAQSYLNNPKYAPPFSEPFPGLEGTYVNITTGLFEDAEGGWVGGDDSYYEYLLKMYIYDPTRFSSYKDRWVLAADSSIEHLKSHPSSRPDLTFMAAYENTTLQYYSEHLACFAGGNFLLGGMVLNEQKYIDYGIALTEGCYQTYYADASGIGPEEFEWLPANGTNTTAVDLPPANQTTFYKDNGFYITSSDYILRPEVLESIYYAYRITGDTKYQDYAWEAYMSINASCHDGAGYAELTRVDEVGGGPKNDFQDSFFFAEVLKYCYLIFAPDAEYDVNYQGSNTWVFNTEAHPFKIAGPQLSGTYK